MRPLQCHAGFPVPLGVGKMEIMGIVATVQDPTLDSRLSIIDDQNLPRGATVGQILTDDNQKTLLFDTKGMADIDGKIGEFYPESIKTNYGISVTNASNLVGGKVMVFVR